MSFGIWDTPSGRSRRWSKRGEAFTPAPMYARVAVVLLAGVLVVMLAWQGAQRLLHPARTEGSVAAEEPSSRGDSSPGMAAWESQVLGALEAASAEGAGGNITASEMDVDRAAAILMSTRMQGQPADGDFFELGISGLDNVLRTHPDNQRLFEHVALAKIELAELRSAQRAGASSLAGDAATAAGAVEGSAEGGSATVEVGPGTRAPHAVTIPGHVVMASPRAVAAGSVLDAATAKGNYIDATLMPETAEIILPPATRLFVDDVRVEGLTFEGASQTLDGIHWKNVTFINTRLRYEGGEVSLSNVRFVGCTFGFSTDERGARMASAIALGQTSFVIE